MEEVTINLLLAMKHELLTKNPFLWGVIVVLVLTLGEFSGLNSLLTSGDEVQSDLTSEETPRTSFIGWVKVIDVVDGDTMRVEQNGENALIRLIGVDTPESVHPHKPVECFGKNAAAKAKAMLDGKRVLLEHDFNQDNKDKYGRYLRYVILEDGTIFNRQMIREGFAYEYTYDGDYKYQTGFKAAQLYAEINKLGFWADGACEI